MTVLTIEHMRPEHIPAVAELERICFGTHWTATNFPKELDNPRCFYYVTLKKQQPVGYLGFWQILEEAHITTVGVHPSIRKRHIAQRMLCFMMDDCLARDVHWITLEVKASNLQAQKLYQKFGFAVMGRRKNYYQADKEDALIMWTENISDPSYQELLQKMKTESSDIEFRERSAS